MISLKIDHENIWYSKNLRSTALLPLSWVFSSVASLRKTFYQLKNSKQKNFPVFVIVVGNITVGGTGKTPFVIWLANYCKAQGLRVGIVTRGYKRTTNKQLVEVQSQSTYSDVGDEALLLALKTACPVMVSVDRKLAVNELAKKYKLDVVLSDDGLQHYNLPRNIEISIVDADRQYGNGRCLPAGPLREPITRLDSCDLIVSNGHDEANACSFDVKVDEVVSLSSDTVRKPVEDFVNLTVHAVAGIGNPSRFFNMLRNAGMNVVEHTFPDHHDYKEAEIEFNSTDPILMTEKDAVKCKKFNNTNIWYLPMSVIPSNALEQRISKIIEGIPHG